MVVGTEFDWKTFCLCFKQRDNGKQVKLITKNSYQHEAKKTSNLLYKDRIYLGPENALQISPLKTIDDGKAFSCLVTYHPERIVKRTTTVKVFGKRLTLTPFLSLSLLLLSTIYSHVLAWYYAGTLTKMLFGLFPPVTKRRSCCRLFHKINPPFLTTSAKIVVVGTGGRSEASNTYVWKVTCLWK